MNCGDGVGCTGIQVQVGNEQEAVGGASFDYIAGMPREPVVTRFAPSPIGQMHLGNARTALFNLPARRLARFA